MHNASFDFKLFLFQIIDDMLKSQSDTMTLYLLNLFN